MGLLSGSAWLVESPSTAARRRRLVALPFAGGGSALFGPWARALPDTAVTAVRMPGREGRFREPALQHVDAVVDRLAPDVAAHVGADGLPWAVFGYSLGGLLAYELVARLVATGGPVPDVLLVGGAEAPHVARDEPPVSWLPDAELIGFLRGLGGTSEEVLDEPELMALLLPTVRADLRMLETYAVPDRPRLPCPVVTYRAVDDLEVRAVAVERWSELTTGPVRHVTVAGGHFVVAERPGELIAAVGADLDRYL